MCLKKMGFRIYRLKQDKQHRTFSCLKLLMQLLLRFALPHHQRNVPLNLHRISLQTTKANIIGFACERTLATLLRAASEALCKSTTKIQTDSSFKITNIRPARLVSAFDSSDSTTAWAAAAASRAESRLLRRARASSSDFVSKADWISISEVLLVVWGCNFEGCSDLRHLIAAEITPHAQPHTCRLQT